MARVADHVYDHALAVSRSDAVARAAAAAALAPSPRSMPTALGAARDATLEAVGREATVIDTDVAAPDGLLDLVWLLVGLRAVDERSIADLAVRHGLDRAGLGRALGRPPTRAGADADAVLDRWETALRPVIVAFLGPGECDGLRDVLADAGLAPPRADLEPDTDPDGLVEVSPAGGEPAERAGADEPSRPTIDALAAAAPAVAEHLEQCDVCPDRVRAMASVRSLLAQVPVVPAPTSLQLTSWRRRPHRPAAAPDGDGDGGRRRHGRRRALAIATVAPLVGAGVAVTLAGDDDGADRVAALTRVPARNALRAVPEEIRPGQVFLLESTVERAIRWRVRAGAETPWLHVTPASGVLGAGRAREVDVWLDDDAPEGALRVDLTVTGHDGSTVLVRLRGSVERPPTVAAAADGCLVTAQVEDETDIEAVELHWRSDDGTTARRPMAAASGGYRAAVPDAAVPARWWVTAVDGRGNRARSPEGAVAGC